MVSLFAALQKPKGAARRGSVAQARAGREKSFWGSFLVWHTGSLAVVHVATPAVPARSRWSQSAGGSSGQGPPVVAALGLVPHAGTRCPYRGVPAPLQPRECSLPALPKGMTQFRCSRWPAGTMALPGPGLLAQGVGSEEHSDRLGARGSRGA